MCHGQSVNAYLLLEYELSFSSSEGIQALFNTILVDDCSHGMLAFTQLGLSYCR